MYSVTIAVKPYVLKFLMARYRPVNGIWEINKQERIGKVLYHMLERMPKYPNKSKLDYGCKLTIGVCDDYFEKRGIYLSNDSIVEFNHFILTEIVEQMVMYRYELKNRIGLKKYRELYVRHNRSRSSRVHVVQDPDLEQYTEIREVIYDVLSIYNITEDDLAFETVRKAVQRLKLPLLNAS